MGKDTDNPLDFFEPTARPPVAPMESSYGGVRFRSKTEARWAVFFDALGIRWLYEPEGYVLECGPYLPDFLLPELRLFVEIKGKAPTVVEQRRCFELAETTGMDVALFPHEPRAFEFARPDSGGTAFFGGGSDDGYWFCLCPVCNKLGLEFEGRGERVCGNDCCAASDGAVPTGDAPVIVEAVRRANGFRFYEPGQAGRRR
jgi:hypothetical protein